jgi:hypothetical protein
MQGADGMDTLLLVATLMRHNDPADFGSAEFLRESSELV